MPAVAARAPPDRAQTPLALEGMPGAACAAGIERALNKLEGVEATVNFATETASVSYDRQHVAQEQLVGSVEKTGYHAPPASSHGHAHQHDLEPTRLIVAVAPAGPLG